MRMWPSKQTKYDLREEGPSQGKNLKHGGFFKNNRSWMSCAFTVSSISIVNRLWFWVNLLYFLFIDPIIAYLTHIWSVMTVLFLDLLLHKTMHQVLISTINASLSEATYNFVLMQRHFLTVGLSCRHLLVLGRWTLFKKEPFPISHFSEKPNIFRSDNEGN